jgi:hypothetical protein
MTLPLRIELAMTFKAGFPDILARDRSGQGRPEVSEAVSLQHTDFAGRCQHFTGRRGGRSRAGNGRLSFPSVGHRDRGSGFLIALVLFSANSGGTERIPAFGS